jgi:predicted RNA-binding Zn ribbon-like protein
MNTTHGPNSASRDPVLKYVGGSPSLDFVNTVDWVENRLIDDRLSDYPRLLDWAEGSGVITPEDAGRLRRAASRYPDRAAAALERAITVRAVLQRVFDELVSDGAPGPVALESFNHAFREALDHLTIGPEPEAGMQWRWRGLEEDLSSVLWPVLWTAAGLLTSDEASKIRKCGGPACGWFYVDRSRNGLRRWCEMSVCGTREKNRRRAARAGRGSGRRAAAADEA